MIVETNWVEIQMADGFSFVIVSGHDKRTTGR